MLASRESYKRGNAGNCQREERMKPFRNLVIVLIVSALLRSFGATDLDKLSVLYVGDADSARAKQFSGFLRKNVAKLEVTSRDAFKPATAEPFDVVLLDWGQSNRTQDGWKEGRSRLG